METHKQRFDIADIAWRDEVRPADTDNVRELCQSSGFFSAEEITVAVELVEEYLIKGEASCYCFLFAEVDGKCLGYTCYGPIPFTRYSWDLYWAAVDDSVRGLGLGKRLVEETEQRIALDGGRQIYVETSSRDQYAPTRAFYKNLGYGREGVFDDFYAPGDSKIVFVKRDFNEPE
jgi:ribosomal protein S18 acetylase RimI-like enzyme